MGALILALLEDSERITEIKTCLELAGHEVCVVNSFARAKAILQDHTFDLIISDVHLQNGGSVFDFLRWVKSQERFRVIPFVLFSLEPNKIAKYLADGISVAARYMGAAKYLSMEKFDCDLLSEEIAKLLPVKTDISVLTKEGE